ncbi:alpha-lytic protease prodomain-containing protein [Streptomyces sp. M19]
MWYVDVRTNSVVVQSATVTDAQAFVTDSRTPGAMVRVRQSAERPHPYAGELHGGDAYYINGGRAARSASR